MAEQQAQRFRRGQQDLRRPHPLPRLAVGRACRRCGSRPGSAAPSRRSGSAGCAARRPPAPSAARCRACAAPRSARSISSASVGRNPASVLPAPVGATSRALPPGPRRRRASRAGAAAAPSPCAREPVGDRRTRRVVTPAPLPPSRSWVALGRRSPASAHRPAQPVSADGDEFPDVHVRSPAPAACPYSSMARLGSWIEAFPRRHLREAGRRLDRSVAAQAARARHPRPCRPCPRRPRPGLGDARDAGDHGLPLRAAGRARRSPMARPIRLGEVDVSFVPAGHVLGSAQIVLEHKGERIVVSGDYKRRPDPTCAPFEPVPCDIFITEATFGLPVFRHPDTAGEIDRLLPAPARQSRALRPGRRLCARQGAAADRGAARPRPSRPDLHPRRAAAAVRPLRGARRAARRAAPGHRRRRRTS